MIGLLILDWLSLKKGGLNTGGLNMSSQFDEDRWYIYILKVSWNIVRVTPYYLGLLGQSLYDK